jgi:hypothetical protein
MLTDEEIVCYQLCFRMVSFVGHQDASLRGLGLNPQTGSFSKGMGRQLFLSKEQSRVAMDIVAGRQLSIFGELRALPTLEGFSK